MEVLSSAITALGWEAFGSLLTALTPVIVLYLKKKIDAFLDTLEAKAGIEIEAASREALHSAASTAATSILASGADLAAESPEADSILETALAYVKKSVPDAIEVLGAVDDVIIALIKSKIGAA